MDHHRADLARALVGLGAALSRLGRPEEAPAVTSEAVMLYRGSPAPTPPHTAGLPADTPTALTGILPDLGRLDDIQSARQEAGLHGGTTRRTVQSALFQLLLFAERQAVEDDLPRARRGVSPGAGRIVAAIRPASEQRRRRARPDHRLIGCTFMTVSTGVPVDSEDLHRFVRRQFAIYSVRGRAADGTTPTKREDTDHGHCTKRPPAAGLHRPRHRAATGRAS